MNILYCGDDGIKDGVMVSVLSLLKHASEPLNIYIMTIRYPGVKTFSERAALYLDKMVRQRSARSFVRLLDATEAFSANPPVKNMGSYFTPCSMLRLYIDKMPELCGLDRLLYLDYDVVCRKDPAKFYEMDLTGIEVAGVLDIYGRRWYRYHGLFTQDYMNSGVMLFNIPECLKTGMFEKAVKLCAKRKMMLADQAALNKVIVKRKLVERKYNEQEERSRKDTVLHHFSNNFKFWPVFRVQKVKPFEVEKVHEVLKIHEYDDILEEYLKLRENL